MRIFYWKSGYYVMSYGCIWDNLLKLPYVSTLFENIAGTLVLRFRAFSWPLPTSWEHCGNFTFVTATWRWSASTFAYFDDISALYASCCTYNFLSSTTFKLSVRTVCFMRGLSVYLKCNYSLICWAWDASNFKLSQTNSSDTQKFKERSSSCTWAPTSCTW